MMYPSKATLAYPHFEDLGKDSDRVRKAYNRHQKNFKEWEETIVKMQHLRYESCLQDRTCGDLAKE
jgi:hypothetical protein